MREKLKSLKHQNIIKCQKYLKKFKQKPLDKQTLDLILGAVTPFLCIMWHQAPCFSYCIFHVCIELEYSFYSFLYMITLPFKEVYIIIRENPLKKKNRSSKKNY